MCEAVRPRSGSPDLQADVPNATVSFPPCSAYVQRFLLFTDHITHNLPACHSLLRKAQSHYEPIFLKEEAPKRPCAAKLTIARAHTEGFAAPKPAPLHPYCLGERRGFQYPWVGAASLDVNLQLVESWRPAGAERLLQPLKPANSGPEGHGDAIGRTGAPIIPQPVMDPLRPRAAARSAHPARSLHLVPSSC